MATAQQPPELNIPHTDSIVEVSIIDTTSHIRIPSAYFVHPPVPGFEDLDTCACSFLIKHNNARSKTKYDTLVFDLGVRTDWESGPKDIVEELNTNPAVKLSAKKDVATILRENGQALETVGGIIWSHWHFDHTGDPRTFPSSTDLIVGPGFKSSIVPAFPTVPDSPVDERAWQGRTLREIDVAMEGKGLKIGKFMAFDFYGDGSFFLFDTPGHAIRHLCALARTTVSPPTFMFLGGDIAHHGGEFRPTQYLPLPEPILPNPLEAPFTVTSSLCPGEIFRAVHPKNSRTEPFFDPTGDFHADDQEARRSIANMTEFDAHDNVFSVVAHDKSLLDVVDFYPKGANDWRDKGWGKEGRWRFLRSFDTKGLGKGCGL